MTDELKSRIAKIYELVQRGATDGERQAARLALDRLMKKYNIDDESLSDIHLKAYTFRYTSQMEQWLIANLVEYFFPELDIHQHAYRSTFDPRSLTRCKQIVIKLTYINYVTLDSSYEYFRRHMKAQWNNTCAKEVAKCRKAKTRNKKRLELQRIFFTRYAYLSKLLKEESIQYRDPSELSQEEIRKHRLVRGVEGGSYSTQVQTAHMLEASPEKKVTGQ